LPRKNCLLAGRRLNNFIELSFRKADVGRRRLGVDTGGRTFAGVGRPNADAERPE
jgi:hypothetical protein